MRAALLAALVVCAAATAAVGQPRRGGVNRPGPGPAAAERIEEVKKQIRAMRAYTLSSELGLDEATAVRLAAALARFDGETDKLLEKRIELQKRLKHADGMRDPREVDRLVDEAVANQRGFWELEERRLVELRKILTPGQTAKLLVVMPALERRIQNQLRQAIVKRGRLNTPGADPGDDDIEPDEVPPPRRPGPPHPGSSNAPGNTPPLDRR